MPTSETICISFGSWIVAFPVVYSLAVIAVGAASAVLIDWSINKIRASRLGSNAKVSRRAQVVELPA